MRKKIVWTLVMILAVTSLSACKDNKKDKSELSEQVEATQEEAEDAVEAEASVNDESAEAKAEDADQEVETTNENTPTEDTDSEESTELVLNEDGTVNYLYYYSSVLSRIHYVMTYPRDDLEYGEGEDWLFEISNYAGGNENLKNHGYCLKDISGDGIPELIFTDKPGMTVYSLYTLVDYKPYLVFDGYFRNRYGYMGGNRFELFASGGAMYQVLGIYELSKNGQELIPIDYYFTCEGATREDMESYHNTIGESDKEKSELIDNDDFLMKWNEYENKVCALDIIPLSEKTIEVAFKEDNPGKKIVGNYTTDTTEYARTVIVYDENGMHDVELLGLNFIDYGDKGNIDFGLTYIYNMGETKGDEAIAITFTFGEVIPLYGIQYKDANNILRKFTFDISGDDGSVYLTEF